MLIYAARLASEDDEGGSRGHVGTLRVGGLEFVVLGPYETWGLSAVLLASRLTPTVTLVSHRILSRRIHIIYIHVTNKSDQFTFVCVFWGL